jgi:hypothetical protein
MKSFPLLREIASKIEEREKVLIGKCRHCSGKADE